MNLVQGLGGRVEIGGTLGGRGILKHAGRESGASLSVRGKRRWYRSIAGRPRPSQPIVRLFANKTIH